MQPEQIAAVKAMEKPAPAQKPGLPGAPKPPDAASGQPLPPGVKNLAAQPPQMPAPPAM
jgi:hypothetical protein